MVSYLSSNSQCFDYLQEEHCCSATVHMPELLAKIDELTDENMMLKRNLQSAEATVGKYSFQQRTI